MTKLHHEIKIIEALIAGEIISITGSLSHYKYKLENGSLMYFKNFFWEKSIFTSFKDLNFENLQLEKQPQSKFKIGQEVWFMNSNRVVKSNISRIIKQDINNSCYFYNEFNCIDDDLSEDFVFATKQELLQSLLFEVVL